MNEVEVLECTLRDGSYVIGYQFTADDTAVLCAALEDAGFGKIEIGHGLGLGASGDEYGVAAATDEDYLAAAASATSKASFGTFFIPGIGTTDDLKLASRYGMKFVRIGTDAPETERAEPFIKEAKQLGFEVSSNLMKTYAISADEVVRRSADLAKWGADIVAVVDSAGGMLPSDTARYVRRLLREADVRVGFHGHNNLQLAVANTIAAVEAGATVVDSSLRGLGRSAGNAQTEIVVSLLQRMGHVPGIDVFKTMDLGDRLVAPLSHGRGVAPIEVACGIAQFHSSFLGLVMRASEEFGVDPKRLIVEVSEIDKVRVSEGLLRDVAEKLASELTMPIGHRQGPPVRLAERHNEIADVLAELRTMALKSGKSTAFTLAPSYRTDADSVTFPFIRAAPNVVIGNADAPTFADAVDVARSVQGEVDVILVATDRIWPDEPNPLVAMRQQVTHSDVLPYRDAAALVAAAGALILVHGPELPVGIVGRGVLAGDLALSLSDAGVETRLWDRGPGVGELARAVNALSHGTASAASAISLSQMVEECGFIVIASPAATAWIDDLAGIDLHQCVLIVLGAAGMPLDGLGIDESRVLRLDGRAGLTAEVSTILESRELRDRVIGRAEIGGHRVVAGGELGRRGDVIVDSITVPERVIGVADGAGGLLRGPEQDPFENAVRAVRQEILRRRIHGN